MVRVAEGASFDAESEGSIDIIVTATSTDGSTSEETFTIAVSDVNEVAVSAVTDIDATANGNRWLNLGRNLHDRRFRRQ